MGVKGPQSFVERCCPEACVTVNLKEMARKHVAKNQQGCTSTGATLVVDGMSCLRHWYSCKDWVCGGQWKEYVDILKRWVKEFNSAGIRLVFFFDGVIEEQKRHEWVKRRHRVNRDISKVFSHIKEYGDQPGKELSCLPSGLATFTPFALRSLGQEVFCSVREADYEIASYARQHDCMGILGQDTDFIIYDSAPYLSVAKLRISSLTTVMYDRQRFCRTMGLAITQLPLLACLLGNDVVSEEHVRQIRNSAIATYRRSCSAPHSGVPQGQLVLAVAQLVSSLCSPDRDQTELIPQALNLAAPLKELLQKGICSYLLPGQKEFELVDITALPSAFEKHVSPEILKACREKHVAAEGFMVYSVVCAGVTECSNSLEDEEDTELLPQALVYKPCRQHIYGLLLLFGNDINAVDIPSIKEWFVYPGNPLKEAEVVHPVPINVPCGEASLDVLWFSTGPEVSALPLKVFLSVFDCLEFFDLYGKIEDCLLAALCLVTYIVLQVRTLSEEDVDAYLSQAVCLRLKTPPELQQIEFSDPLFPEDEAVFDWKQVAGRATSVCMCVCVGEMYVITVISARTGQLPVLSSRAVQLGSLYVRGLSHLLGANNASGCPLPSAAVMPWHSFDGQLFHSKYLLAHRGVEKTELLDSDMSCLSQFLQLKEKLLESCKKRGRILQSKPRVAPLRVNPSPGGKYKHSGFYQSVDEDHRRRGEMAGGHRREQEWRERTEERGGQNDCESRERLWDRGGQHFQSFHPNFYEDKSRPPKQSRGRMFHNRGKYRLAPRWPHPSAP